MAQLTLVAIENYFPYFDNWLSSHLSSILFKSKYKEKEFRGDKKYFKDLVINHIYWSLPNYSNCWVNDDTQLSYSINNWGKSVLGWLWFESWLRLIYYIQISILAWNFLVTKKKYYIDAVVKQFLFSKRFILKFIYSLYSYITYLLQSSLKYNRFFYAWSHYSMTRRNCHFLQKMLYE